MKSFSHLLGLLIFRILIDYIYLNIIYPNYNYIGFLNNSTTQSTIISYSLFLFFVPLFLRVTKDNKISAQITSLLFLISFVPMSSVIRFMPIGFWFLILYSIYWFLLLIFYIVVPDINLSTSLTKRSLTLIRVCLILMIASVLFISGKYFSFRVNLDLLNVWELRKQERALDMPIILRYFETIAGNVLPFFLVYFLYVKKNLVALLIGFILLLDFSIAGAKTVFFNLIISFIGYWLLKSRQVPMFTWGLNILSALAIVETKVLHSFWLVAIIIRRVLFVPSVLNYYYYDYFSKNEPDFLRQGILRWFGLSSPYETHIPRLIGSQYYGNIETNANNGLFSDAFMNFNFLGVFIFPLILIIIFKLYDSTSEGLNPRLLFLPVVVCTISFISSSFSTALLTQGVFLQLIILYYMPREKEVFYT
jgi:hypothetical protein